MAVNMFFQNGRSCLLFFLNFTSKKTFDTKTVRPLVSACSQTLQPEPGLRSQWSKSDLQFIQAGAAADRVTEINVVLSTCSQSLAVSQRAAARNFRLTPTRRAERWSLPPVSSLQPGGSIPAQQSLPDVGLQRIPPAQSL